MRAMLWAAVFSAVLSLAAAALPSITPIEHASVLLSYAAEPPATQLYADPVDAKGRCV